MSFFRPLELFKALFSSICAHTLLILCSYGHRCPKSNRAKAFAIVLYFQCCTFVTADGWNIRSFDCYGDAEKQWVLWVVEIRLLAVLMII